MIEAPRRREIVALVVENTDGNAGSQGSGTGGLCKPVERIPLKNNKSAASASKQVDPRKLIHLGDEEFKDF